MYPPFSLPRVRRSVEFLRTVRIPNRTRTYFIVTECNLLFFLTLLRNKVVAPTEFFSLVEMNLYGSEANPPPSPTAAAVEV